MYRNEFVIQTYEAWLGQIEAGMCPHGTPAVRWQRLSAQSSRFTLDRYLDAVTRVHGGDRNNHFVTTYERILKVATQLPEEAAMSASVVEQDSGIGVLCYASCEPGH